MGDKREFVLDHVHPSVYPLPLPIVPLPLRETLARIDSPPVHRRGNASASEMPIGDMPYASAVSSGM